MAATSTQEAPTESASYQIRSTLLAAARPISGVRIDIAATPAAEGFHVVGKYTIELTPGTRGRYVVLDYAWCQLRMDYPTCTGANFRDLRPLLGEYLFALELPNDRDAPQTVQLEVIVNWKVGLEHPAAPYFLANSFLPRVLMPEADESELAAATHLYCSPETLAALEVVGVQLDPGEWDPVRRAQLELGLIPRGDVCDRVGEVVFVADVARAAPAETRRQIADAVREMVDFLAGEFGFRPALRIACCPSRKPDRIPSNSRVFVVEKPEYFGLEDKPNAINLSALRRTGVWELANLWWGSVTDMTSHLGMAVRSGINFTLMLRRLAQQRRTAVVEHFQSYIRDKAANNLDRTSKSGDRLTKVQSELALALYPEMERPEVMAALRAIVRECRGRQATPRFVLARLKAVGIELPNGARRLAS